MAKYYYEKWSTTIIGYKPASSGGARTIIESIKNTDIADLGLYLYPNKPTFSSGLYRLSGSKVLVTSPAEFYDLVDGGEGYEKHAFLARNANYSRYVIYTYYRVPEYGKDRFIEMVTAEDGTYPDNGIQGNYWYVKGDLANSPPIISGQDHDLGDKNTGFTITYSVDDADVEDTLTVKEKINGKTIRTINNAPRNQEFTIEITEEMLYSYPLHTTNTIEIEVDDGEGHVVYRRYTFRRTNTAPKISGEDKDLGEKTEGFDITFSAIDQENDTMSAKVYLNDRLVKTYEVIEPDKEYIYTLGKLEFVQLNNTDVHKIRIEVQDHNNATAIRNYTFTRKVDRIMYAFEKETDIMATQILISPTWGIAEGAEAQVLVCNNVFDEEPTWEDATEQVLLERHFNFVNDTKTADKWGIGVQLIINKGTATELSYLAGFGGAYK